MKAARLHEYKKPLQIDQIEDPKIGDSQGVVVRITGSGFCHSDLYQINGDMKETSPLPLPYILGHENAGYVHRVGDEVVGFEEGEPVIVYGGWGCGLCQICREGNEQLCPNRRWAGVCPQYQGGYAEYLYVPSYKYLLKVEEDPSNLAPLTDAALSSYRPVKKARPYLQPTSYAAVIGIGGLGSFAVQYLKLLTGSHVIAIDIDDEKLKLARELGADYTVNSSKQDVVKEVKALTENRGTSAVLDFVGIEITAHSALQFMAKQGIYIDMGLAGGIAKVHLPTLTRTEIVITGSGWGNYNELREVYGLYKARKLNVRTKKRSLDEINDVAEEMRRSSPMERIIMVP